MNWIRAQLRRTTADDGFTIIELVVAMMIIMVVLTAALLTFTSSVRSVAVAKQRLQVTDLATKTMEELRALPYDVIRGGLLDTDLAPDPNIAGSGCPTAGRSCFAPTFDSTIKEDLVYSGGSSNVPPLRLHIGPVQQFGNLSVRLQTYVSYDRTSPTGANVSPTSYNLTVVAYWWSTLLGSSAKPNVVVQRTTDFSPQGGCLSAATHPFSSPCEPQFGGQAGVLPGQFHLTGSIAGVPPVYGLDLSDAAVSLAQYRAHVATEQASTADARGDSTAVDYTTSSGTTRLATGALVEGDNDPATGSLPGEQKSWGPSPGASPIGAGGSLLYADSATSDGGQEAATANATLAVPCKDLTGMVETGHEICAYSSGRTAATSDLRLKLEALNGVAGGHAYGAARNYGDFAVASAAAAPSATTVFSSRYGTPDGSYCASATGDGCVAAGVTRALGTSTLGGLPAFQSGDQLFLVDDATGATTAISPPVGAFSAVTLSNYADRAVAESGTGAGTTTATQLSGTLQEYWRASSYSAPFTPGTDTAHFRAVYFPDSAAPGSTVTIDLTATVVRGPAPSATANCTTTAPIQCTARASSPSPITVTLAYRVDTNVLPALAGQGNLANFTVSANLGELSAQTTYVEAPAPS